MALPAVVIALFRGAGHTRAPDLATFVQTWGFLTFGVESELGVALGTLLFAALLILALYDKPIRLPLATLVFSCRSSWQPPSAHSGRYGCLGYSYQLCRLFA
jgi:hypothetical protein